ncbi:MAG: hypothetical protein PHI23_03815 [Candidatus Peribacteraceae bacterium]|nr:hypothetical protein [Candidatus Peribacteraceae bacterium]
MKNGAHPTIAELQQERESVIGPFETLQRQEHLLRLDEFSGGLLRGLIEHPSCGQERCAQVLSTLRQSSHCSFLDVLRHCLPREELAAFLATRLQAVHQQRSEINQLDATLPSTKKKPLLLPLNHSEQIRYISSCIEEIQRPFLRRLREETGDRIRMLFHQPPHHRGQVEHLLVDASLAALPTESDPMRIAEDFSCLTLPPPPKHATILEALTPALATLEQVEHRRLLFNCSFLQHVRALQQRARSIIQRATDEAARLRQEEHEKAHRNHWSQGQSGEGRNNGELRAEAYLRFVESFPSPLATQQINKQKVATPKPVFGKHGNGHRHDGHDKERGPQEPLVTARAT